MAEPEKYWFPAKRYGWGWGLPVTWQGRAAFCAACYAKGEPPSWRWGEK